MKHLCWDFLRILLNCLCKKLRLRPLTGPYKRLCSIQFDMRRFAQFGTMYNLKTLKNTHGRVLLLLKLQSEACDFGTPSWVFLTILKLHKQYQIAQSITYCLYSSLSFLQLPLSLRTPLTNRNQLIDLQRKSMDQFLYDSKLPQQRVTASKDVSWLHCKFNKFDIMQVLLCSNPHRKFEMRF